MKPIHPTAREGFSHGAVAYADGTTQRSQRNHIPLSDARLPLRSYLIDTFLDGRPSTVNPWKISAAMPELRTREYG